MKLKCGTCGKTVCEVRVDARNTDHFTQEELDAGEAIAAWATDSCPELMVKS